MINIPRWKIVLVVLVCLWAVLYSLPNVMPASVKSTLQTLPGWMPSQTVNLGLDLQGGSHLLLEVETDVVIKERVDGILQETRRSLRKENIGYTRITALPDGVRVTLRQDASPEEARKLLRKTSDGLEVLTGADERTIEARLTETAMLDIRRQTINQSIEIVRRRIDETGTKEPVIAQQGEDRIIVQLPGVDDPQRIRDILGKTAKLTFHLVDTGAGRVSGGTRVLPMAEDNAQRLTIERRAMLTGDMLTNAQPSFQEGRPVVSFNLNGIGARRFCDVTSDNVGQPFAIVLDNEIISAPNIQTEICGGAAIITGNFTVQETSDLSLLLRAGALPAPLNVMEERTVGPSLGADSVEAGKKASIVALLFVLLFMGVSYGGFGLFANIALLINVCLIFAALSTLQATLTLPGIAGIVLTIGMAVDANVLIFERIREEIRQGCSPIAAIDAGYSRAMATIIDSNLTTLIAAIILASFGTGPIKGFAVTLMIGIATSLFSAIMITRLLVITWLRRTKPSELPV